jgi:hypothetical protein
MNETKSEVLGGNQGFTRNNILDTLTTLSEDFSFISFPLELKAGIIARNILATMYKGEHRESPAHTIPLEACIARVTEVLNEEPNFNEDTITEN